MELRKGEPGDVEGVAASMARAFDDDPWVDWLVRKDARRAEAILGFFRLTYGRLAMRWRESWVDPELRGAAMWAPPGQWHLSFLGELGALPAFARIVSLRRVWSVWRATQPIASAHPPEPHWYLLHLGVDPSAQGQGLGAALCRPVLERCDREGSPAYLETAKERNLAFYRKLGFEIVAELPITGGPMIWGMWRKPAVSAGR
jgi:ribosomal protein S18 acetylase RimI-like enzyme